MNFDLLFNTGERTREVKTLREAPAIHFKAYMFASELMDLNEKYVCDVGCGVGYGAFHMALKGARVTAVDPSTYATECGKKNFGHPNLLFSNLPIKMLAGNQFHLVTCCQVIEHVDDYGGFMNEISRILKPGGIAVISTPNKMIASCNLPHPRFPFHVHEFYRIELQKLGEKAIGPSEVFGQYTANMEMKSSEMAYRKSLRFRIIQWILEFQWIRAVARSVPLCIKSIISRQPRDSTNLEDFGISKDLIYDSENLIMVSRKPYK